MIIFGLRNAHVKTVKSETSTCESCGKHGSILLSTFRRHIHVFWIPMFPVGKNGFSECQHCKNVLEPKEMPAPLKREFDGLKSDAKGPIWQFSGLGLIAVLVVVGIYTSGQDKEQELIYISSPVEGDVYEYKIEARSYSTLKVVAVSDDSVFVSPNEYETSRRSKIYKIDKAENYADYTFGISREKLKEMYDAGDIFDINR